VSELEHPLKRLNLRKNVLFAVGEFAINAILLFVGYRLLIEQGGLEAVGVWSTLYAWTNLIRLGDAGVAGAATRFLALWDVRHEQARLRSYGETALLTNIAQFSVLSLLAYVALSPSLDRITGTAHAAQAAAVLPWLLLGFFLLNVGGTVQGMLQGLHLGYRRSQLSIAGTAIQLAAVLILVPTLGLKGLAWAQILQHGTISIVGWLLVRRRLGGGMVPHRFDAAAFRDMLSYSLKAQVVNIANGFVEPLSKMLVAHFGGMKVQGLYELAYKTVLMPRNLVATGVTATIPSMATLSRENPEQLRALYNRAFRLSSRLMAAATVAVIALAPVPSFLFLGRVDTTYWLYVAFLVVGFLGNVIGMPAYVLGMAAGHMRYNMAATLVTVCALAALGFLAGKAFGGTAVVAVSACMIGMCGIAIWLANRTLVPAFEK
jgi:O-antigen/teichoic acid export membrane protein